MSIPNWATSILRGHLLDDEDPLACYDEDDLALVVTDRRLLSISRDRGDSQVESVHLKGDHIIGSNVTSTTDDESGEVGILFLLAGGGVWHFLSGTLPTIGAVVLVVLGLAALFTPPETATTIEVETIDGSIPFEIPEEAEHLGQTVSKVVAEDM